MNLPVSPELPARPFDWPFWIKWVASSAAATLLGFGLLYALLFLALAVMPGVNEDRFAGGLMFPVLATMLGAAQWLILRTRVARSGWWIPATVAGVLAGLALGSAASEAIRRAAGRTGGMELWPDLLVLYALVGLCAAIVQLPVLRRHMAWSALWPLVSMAGWLALGLVLGRSITGPSDMVALGAVPAAFTGLGLILLLRDPHRPC